MPLTVPIPLWLRTPAEVPAVGDVLANAGLVSVQTGPYALTQVNQCMFFPLNVWDAATFNVITINVVTARVGGTSAAERIGLYGSSPDGSRPVLSDQRYDWGQSPALDTTGLKTISPTAFTLQPGRYWLAGAYQVVGTPSTYPQLTVVSTGMPAGFTGVFPVAGNVSRCWIVTGVSGALPTSGTLVTGIQNPPVIGLTRSA